jgi:class 3 adenylate cyclase
MEPRIQYAQTTDGVSIAFWTLGEGTPLVHMPPLPWSHVQLEWQDPDYRRWYEGLASNRRLVRYDNRGSGLSDRIVSDISFEATTRDLEAVVDRLKLERFALVGLATSGPTAIAYAARHPERVSHLILWCTYATPLHGKMPQYQAILSLGEKEWELFTETMAHALVAGWASGERGHRQALFMRASTTPEVALPVHKMLGETDVAGLLLKVRVPTLVVHRDEVIFPKVDLAKTLASRIPDAQLVVLNGDSLLPFAGDTESVLGAIDEFLSEGEEAAAGVEALEGGAFRTILFTDVEGSTALTQRLGDAKAREVLREHERMVREALKSHGGAEVKTMGDGFMASFTSATGALESAIAMQRAFAERNEAIAARPSTGSGRAEEIRVRIGLNAGEPIAEEDPDGRSDLFGTAVILAARIAAKAKGGEVLASDVVRQLVAGKRFLFADRGETALKGFDETVRLHEVRWREGG